MAARGVATGLIRVHNKQTLGPSADTGPIMLEAAGMKSWAFMARSSGVVTAGSLTIYGTTDPDTAGSIGIPNSQLNTGANARWFVLVAPSEQGGTGSVVNPITAFDGSQMMDSNLPLKAVRYTTNAFTGGGSIIVDAEATG